MEQLIANLSNKVQKRTLSGLEYLVAPVVMLLEGVFAGNKGPYLYEGADLAKSASSWNGRPIMASIHPENQNGQKVSGCTPEALDKLGCGMILNTKWQTQKKRLVAEAWFDARRLDVVPGGAEIKKALETGQTLEVSTGLFSDSVMTNGNYAGKEYVAKATNYRPDHLAVLLHEVGACSRADGAGLLVNKAAETEKPKMPTPHKHYDGIIVTNANISELVEGVEDAVKAAYGYKMNPDNPMPPMEWLDDIEVFSNYVVFCIETPDSEIYYRESFEVDGENVKLLGNRIVVTKKVTYSPLVTNAKVSMDKTKLFALLGDEHKAFVESLTEPQVAAIAKLSEPVTNAAPAIKTVEDAISASPVDVQAVLKEALVANAAARQSLVDVIVANAQNTFTSDELAGFPTATLTKLASLAVVPKAPEVVANAQAKPPVYAGSATPAVTKVTETGFLPPSTLL